MRSLVVLALGLLGACAPSPYAAGGIARERDVEASSLRAAGCLELALGLRPPANPDDSALLVARVGNRCLRPAAFDLDSAALTGYDEEGNKHVLHLVDPRDEITLLHVDAGVTGVEKVRVAGSDRPLRMLCVDVTRALVGAPPLAPVCFVAKGASAWEVAS